MFHARNGDTGHWISCIIIANTDVTKTVQLHVWLYFWLYFYLDVWWKERGWGKVNKPGSSRRRCHLILTLATSLPLNHSELHPLRPHLLALAVPQQDRRVTIQVRCNRLEIHTHTGCKILSTNPFPLLLCLHLGVYLFRAGVCPHTALMATFLTCSGRHYEKMSWTCQHTRCKQYTWDIE